MQARFAIAALGMFCAGSAFASQVEITNAVQLSVGKGHACILTATGGVKCWGANLYGQLGSGPSGAARSGANDVSGLVSGVVFVEAARGSHSCAVMSGGGVKCWGSNSSGQLGDGTTTDRAAPVDVQGLPFAAIAVAGGMAHTCALSNMGAVACWGRNNEGQLGDGTTTSRSTPAVVTGLSEGVAAIAAGYESTCAVMAMGAAKCWGGNAAGELGDGTLIDRTAPVDVVGLGSGVRQITIDGDPGGMFTGTLRYACAAMMSGGVKCWGSSMSTTPSDVAGIAGVSSITVGAGLLFAGPLAAAFPLVHYCVSTTSGGAKCWGIPHCNALGSGTSSCGPVPGTPIPPALDVAGLSGVVAVYGAGQGGGAFTCALMSDARVKCWGGSTYGATPIGAVEGTTPQSISSLMIQPTTLFTGGTGHVTANGNGNPIVFTSLTPSTCSVGPAAQASFGSPSYIAPVTALAAGTCTIASDQPGDAFFDPAPRQTVDVKIDAHLAQTIAISLTGPLAENGVTGIQAISSSGLPVNLEISFSDSCMLSGNLLYAKPFTAGQACSVIATQPGNASYAPAGPVYADFVVQANTGQFPLAVYKFGGGAGNVISSLAGIDCGVACGANFAVASTVTLSATPAAGSSFAGWTGACSGTGTCNVSMNAAKTVGANFASATPHVANLSTRGHVAAGNEALIAGFVTGGTSAKTVVITATGPSLCALGVNNCLQSSPLLQLFSFPDGRLVRDSSVHPSWQREAEAIGTMGFGVGSNEAAMLVTLPPGAYTAVVQGASPGVGLVGVYEIDNADQPLVNLSTRGEVLTGDDVLIGGFVVQGGSPQTVVVRGRGPSMSAFGVGNVLANPVLRLVRMADGVEIASNDDWQGAANAGDLIASGFAPTDAREAAVLITLPPGAYTAIVSGAAGATGVGAVDIFRVQ